MPSGHEYRLMREFLWRERLQELINDEEVIRWMTEPDGVFNVLQNRLDLSAKELRWLGAIPKAQREAMRGLVNYVAGETDVEYHIDLQFEPSYNFGLQIYEFDDQIVMRISGPMFDAPSGG